MIHEYEPSQQARLNRQGWLELAMPKAANYCESVVFRHAGGWVEAPDKETEAGLVQKRGFRDEMYQPAQLGGENTVLVSRGRELVQGGLNAYCATFCWNFGRFFKIVQQTREYLALVAVRHTPYGEKYPLMQHSPDPGYVIHVGITSKHAR